MAEKPRKERIVEQLLTESGLSPGTAEEVYFQLVDYLDGDSTTAKEGPKAMRGLASCPRGNRQIR